MKKIVYLFGAGAIQGEIEHQGIGSDATMTGLNENVYKMSKKRNGEYYRMTQRHSIPFNQDVELMMSLLEGFSEERRKDFIGIHTELRKLVRECLISQITQKKIVPRLMVSLFHFNRKYYQHMEADGEEMLGVLTTNYDSLVEEGLSRVYEGLNLACDFHSKDYKSNTKAPFLLKLHGSFNWRIHDNTLEISRKFENVESKDDYTGWIPPSVYKKPSMKIFKIIWDKASELLTECDILRVIGSSLRSEDWCLLSLIFTSRILSKKAFDIELIVPELTAVGDDEHPNSIMQRLTFLGKAKSLSALPVFDVNMMNRNTFFQWLINKAREIERKDASIREDAYIYEMLYGEK